MTSCAAPESQLLFRFQEFYSELFRLREELSASPDSRKPSLETVSQELGDLLERQAGTARALLDRTGFEVYREAQYVMAALADDIFLHAGGQESHVWPSLERRLFRASSAGEMFFQKLEGLLHQNDPVYVELAQIYLLALCLGFQGRYRTAEDSSPLALYREKLFGMIFGVAPVLFRERDHLLPLAPAKETRTEEVRSLPQPRLWMALPVGVVLLWVIFSFAFWTGFVRPISGMIHSTTSSVPAGGH